jgi:hypothetical protein
MKYYNVKEKGYEKTNETGFGCYSVCGAGFLSSADINCVCGQWFGQQK